MTEVAAWLERWLHLLVVALAVLGLLWPGPAHLVVDDHGITVALVVLVAAVGLGLPMATVVHSRQYAGRIAVTVLVSAVVLPAVAFAASRAVTRSPTTTRPTPT